MRCLVIQWCLQPSSLLLAKYIKVAKLVFAKEHVTWTDDNWSKSILATRANFILFVSDVHQRTEKRLLIKFVMKSVKFGKESVMV